jgi:hypothetical protein
MDHQGFTSAREALDFIFGGNAVFTVTSAKTGKHFTFKARKPKDGGKDRKGFEFKGDNPNTFFNVLSNGRNTAWDEQLFVGFTHDAQRQWLKTSRKNPDAADWPSFKALSWTLQQLNKSSRVGDDSIPAELTIQHEGACGRCNRPLTDPVSIARGIGPECIKK